MGAPSQDGRDARGDATRERLVAAALRLFGDRGFDAVTTREVARAAGANQAAILYHFGGKDRLYLAVAERVAERGGAALAQLTTPAAPRPGRRTTVAAPDVPRALADAMGALVRGLLDFDDAGAAVAFVAREQAQPGPGFDLLYARYLGPVHERVAALVAAATGRDPTADSVLLDTHALVGMALGFVVARATLLRRLARPAYTPADVNAIAARVAELATTALGVRILNPPSAGARARRAAPPSAEPPP